MTEVSNNLLTIIYLQWSKKQISEFNDSVHYKMNTDMSFYLDFRFLNSCGSTSRPNVKEDYYNCSQKWSMYVTLKVNEVIELNGYYEFIQLSIPKKKKIFIHLDCISSKFLLGELFLNWCLLSIIYLFLILWIIWSWNDTHLFQHQKSCQKLW